MFKNKTILVTGGTGSFGQMFVKYFLNKHSIKKIIIYSRNEYNQFSMSEDFKKYKKKLRFFIGDVRDIERLKMALNDVDYVVHAAALKHVNIAEYNPQEFVKTNINGAENVITACIEKNIKKVVALSTDKAVNPINLYGSTKLASDKLFVAANNLVGKKKTIFSIVRYGNVINSSGSVIPYFKKIIEQKKNFLPITDKRMTRFVIKLIDGVQFVEKAFLRMQGGEVFIPKSPSVKIMDLANAINQKIPKKIVGIRPGEKIHESLFSKDESQYCYKFKDHFVISPNINIYSMKKIDYSKNLNNEKGKLLENKVEYISGSNEKFLTINEIKKNLFVSDEK